MSLRFAGSTSGYTEIDAPAVAGSNTFFMPTSNGIARQTMMTDGAGALSFSWNGGSLFYRLNANVVGANVATAQSVFGVGVTLAASTVYQMEAVYLFNKTVGASSHFFSVGFGGTATINNIGYSAAGIIGNSVPLNSNYGETLGTSTASRQVTSSAGSATLDTIIRVFGSVSINASGTFIPQYTLSAAPGGAYSTVAGSYIKFTPIGAAGSTSSQGTWS